MMNIDLDSDNEGKLKLAFQGNLIPRWKYEDSQIAHENKRIHIAEVQRQAVEAAEKEQQKKQKTQQRQKQLSTQQVLHYRNNGDELTL